MMCKRIFGRKYLGTNTANTILEKIQTDNVLTINELEANRTNLCERSKLKTTDTDPLLAIIGPNIATISSTRRAA
jgi:hypothetical protein